MAIRFGEFPPVTIAGDGGATAVLSREGIWNYPTKGSGELLAAPCCHGPMMPAIDISDKDADCLWPLRDGTAWLYSEPIPAAPRCHRSLMPAMKISGGWRHLITS